MAAGTTIKLKRKAGAFIGGNLAAGELGLDTTNSILYGSIDGSTVFTIGASSLSDGDKGDITVSASGATWTIDNDVVTYSKIQNVSATDKLLGRSTAGAGDIEEITCTAAGRALLDDASASAQRTTLSLGNVENTAISTWAGSTNITTLGTISTGTIPLANVGDSTTEALGVGSLEVGHASDTTISRSSAGIIAVEGVAVPTISSISTLTNKTLTSPTINDGNLYNAFLDTPNLNDPILNNVAIGYRTQATTAGITTLTSADVQNQIFTGTTTQTCRLPTTSVLAGATYYINNQSTGAVTVQSSGANTIVILAGGTKGIFVAQVNTPTTAANWSFEYEAVNVTSNKKLNVSNTLTLSGTDGTTMTFPSTSATIARTDAANTFIGVQTMTSPNFTTPVLGTPSSGTLTNCTGLPTAGLLDDAVTLAKMAAGTAGNLITYDASGNPAAVATGTSGHVLTSNGAGSAPTFQAVAGGDVSKVGTPVNNQVGVWTGDGTIEGDADLTFDTSTNTLTITNGKLALPNGTLISTPTTPSLLGSDQNNYNPSGNSYHIRLGATADSYSISGLTFTPTQIDGQVHRITNVDIQELTLVHESASSTAANRFSCSTGADIAFSINETIDLWYDGTISRWRATKITPASLADYAQGPASSTDNALARFNSTTGKILQNSGVTLNDNGEMVFPAGGTADAPIKLTAGTNLTTAEAGAYEYDGKVFYTTPVASARGVSPSMMFAIVPAGGYSLTAGTALQDAFPAGTDLWTLAGSTSYFFEGVYHITSTGTANISLAFTLSGGASVTSIGYHVHSCRADANATAASSETGWVTQTSATQVTISTAGAKTIKFEGIIRMNAGGQVAPQIQFSASPTSPTMSANSYIKFTPIGTNTVESVGNVG